MGECSRAANLARAVVGAAFVVALAGCAQAPINPSSTHIRANDPGPEGTIPAPVQVAPMLPPPTPAPRAETYSVVVNNVRVQDLLFALARDANVNVDIYPGITGSVTLNAIDQTLPQLLSRIAKQVDIRYEMDGPNLTVMRDVPFLRSYKIDYLSAARTVTMKSTASTQFGGAAGAGGGSGSSATGGTATIDVVAENKLWESVVQNVKDILRETDKIVPKTSPVATPQPQVAAQPTTTTPGVPAAQPAPPQQTIEYIESASVIGNRESGTLYVRATSKQHEKLQEFLDLVMAGARRQVLIEATIAEVQLRNEYQRGIEWQRLALGIGPPFPIPTVGLSTSSGFRFQQPATGAPAGFNPNPFTLGYVSGGNNFSVTLKLLEQFGDVRVLSSPKLSVLNNQTALLRVTRDIIYFTLTPATISATAAVPAGGTVNIQPAFTTTPNVAAEGFMMSVLPQISDTDAVVLTVRPSIRRQVGFARDPNPVLQGQTTQNDIPLFETREFDSILRLQSGDTGVLAGLMQDAVENEDTGIPGVRNIPGIGALLSRRADLTRKTELVIFLRTTVLRDASVEGDFRRFRELLPNDDFFRKPNPGRVAPLVGPSGELLQ